MWKFLLVNLIVCMLELCIKNKDFIFNYSIYYSLKNVKSKHHFNSTAIISYIFNTSFNSQLTHDWFIDVKSVHRQQFKLIIFKLTFLS